MGFTNWLNLGKKKNQDLNVTKIKKQAVHIGEMAAGNQTAASEALNRMMAQKNGSPKILMVQDGDYLLQVTEYALKMAQRLDCEVVALDVSNAPLLFSGERREREVARFEERATNNNKTFALEAQAMGVVVKHVMEVAESEDVIARLSAEDAAIRYVLTKPDQESSRADNERAQVPVFDLNCSHLAR